MSRMNWKNWRKKSWKNDHKQISVWQLKACVWFNITRFTIDRKHRIVMPRNDDHASSKSMILWIFIDLIEEDVTLTVPLSEEAVIEDLRYMSSEMAKMTKKYDVNAPNVVVVLPGNRLIINDLFIEPGVSCVLKNNMETFVGQFVSVDSKEVDFTSFFDSSLVFI